MTASPPGEIAAVIVAAGHSRRMGRPKALLPWPPQAADDPSTLAAHLVQLYAQAGCRPVLLVVSATIEAAVRSSLAAQAGGPPQPGVSRCTVQRRPPCRLLSADPDLTMIDSLRVGLRGLPAATRAVLMQPVDCPGTTGALLAALCAAHGRSPERIIVPRHAASGAAGHPVLFPAACVPALLGPAADRGARQLLASQPADVQYLDWPDERIAWDLDTPADYERLARAGR